jgi:Ca-activated chloride channel family protein
MKIRPPLALCAIIIFLSASCSPGLPAKLIILEANFKYSRGRYNEAVVSYHKALQYRDAAPYAEYALGSAYYALDEAKAALDRYEESGKILETLAPGEHRELRYRNSYNTGVALFGEGDFSAAANAFREALKVDPARIEAKRNLELSLLSLGRENAGNGNAGAEQGESADRTIMFDYVRQHDRSQWKSREWEAEEPETGPDY